MAHDHSHHHNAKHEKPMWWAFAITLTFLVIEVVGGVWSNSLALLSDAAHMATDVLALGIALFALRMGQKPADAKRTYGYARMEAIGALVNGTMLFLLAVYILIEAVQRFIQPPEVMSIGMMVVAVCGLVANLVSMRLLHAGSEENLNVKGAYLEVWADMIGSIGVLIGAGIIWLTGWTIIDPIIAVLIGLWVLPRAWSLVKEAVNVLMEGVPQGMNRDEVHAAMMAMDGVLSVHDLHLWSLQSKEPLMTAHVVLSDEQADPHALRRALTLMLHERFGIDHATLQIESEACPLVDAHSQMTH